MDKFHATFYTYFIFLLTRYIKIDLKRIRSENDGLTSFFQITKHNNNRRELCISGSHNMHYLLEKTFLGNK